MSGELPGDFGNFTKVGVIGKCLLISLIYHPVMFYFSADWLCITTLKKSVLSITPEMHAALAPQAYTGIFVVV